jgi:hypothetical protein
MLSQKEIWPNFFIVGAQKAGTTSLYGYLKQIPQVYMSPIKEPYYFMTDISFYSTYPGRVIANSVEYLSLFSDVKNESAIGEASPFYLWDQGSPTRIHNLLPGSKILIILRNPVARAYSHYLYMIRFGYEKSLSFYKALRRDIDNPEKKWGCCQFYVELGLYSDQVKRYIDLFGEGNVKILIFEEFVSNVKESLSDILKFLNVDCGIPRNFKEKAFNSNPYSKPRITFEVIVKYYNQNRLFWKMAESIPSSIRNRIIERFLVKKDDKPEIEEEARDLLSRIYSKDVMKLETILGRSLSWNLI